MYVTIRNKTKNAYNMRDDGGIKRHQAMMSHDEPGDEEKTSGVKAKLLCPQAKIKGTLAKNIGNDAKNMSTRQIT